MRVLTPPTGVAATLTDVARSRAPRRRQKTKQRAFMLRRDGRRARRGRRRAHDGGDGATVRPGRGRGVLKKKITTQVSPHTTTKKRGSFLRPPGRLGAGVGGAGRHTRAHKTLTHNTRGNIRGEIALRNAQRRGARGPAGARAPQESGRPQGGAAVPHLPPPPGPGRAGPPPGNTDTTKKCRVQQGAGITGRGGGGGGGRFGGGSGSFPGTRRRGACCGRTQRPGLWRAQ